MNSMAQSTQNQILKNQKGLFGGFSLVELMVVVAVIGLLAAIGLPSLMTWIENSKIRATAEAVLSGIQSARTEAIRRNQNTSFILLPGGGLLWKVCVDCAGASIQERPLSEGGASAIGISAAANTTIVFNGFGRTDLAAQAAWDLTSSKGDRSMRILIDVGGSTQVCDPGLGSSIVGSCP